MTHFPPNLFAGKRFAVVGLGRNGLPAAQALSAMGAAVLAWDDSEAARDAARDTADGLELRDLRTGPFDLDALILSPGIPHIRPSAHPIAARARENGVPILTDVELLYQAVRRAGSRARFAGITGTNGKSTTTALLAHILAGAGIPVAAGANLGPAALSLPLLPDDGIYVLELSSYMLERIETIRFDTSVMLNLTPDHMERHGDMNGYACAKSAIFARQGSDDLAVIGIDDEWGRRTLALAATRARVVTVSGHQPADVWCQAGELRDAGGIILDMQQAPALPGAHNAQNAAAAAAMAGFLGASRDAIRDGLRTYPGLPHRQQRITTIDGIAFVNDSKATNADASARALGCYDRIIWIAGGLAKEGGIEPLASYFPRLVHTLLIGQDAPVLAGTLARHGVPHETVETLDAAVPAALAAARRTGTPVVLLSPACASFDQFTGFDARGDRFADLARGLGGGGA
ncbi:MAG: UDP-N-acetylmuramoyl-L-alanine--D-glutamate ligase [Acetobacteraceae bacterium]